MNNPTPSNLDQLKQRAAAANFPDLCAAFFAVPLGTPESATVLDEITRRPVWRVYCWTASAKESTQNILGGNPTP